MAKADELRAKAVKKVGLGWDPDGRFNEDYARELIEKKGRALESVLRQNLMGKCEVAAEEGLRRASLDGADMAEAGRCACGDAMGWGDGVSEEDLDSAARELAERDPALLDALRAADLARREEALANVRDRFASDGFEVGDFSDAGCEVRF